jgi:error-prone DNA polymerase
VLRALPGYAELHCRSNFSFLSGASHPEELALRAHALGYAALAITDECSLAGVVRAHGECRRLGLHLIVGAEMQLIQPDAKAGRSVAAPLAGEAPRLVLLAQSRRGYGNLSQWITVARRRAPKGAYIALMGDVEGKVPNTPTLAGLPDNLALLLPPLQFSGYAPVRATAPWAESLEPPSECHWAKVQHNGAWRHARICYDSAVAVPQGQFSDTIIRK